MADADPAAGCVLFIDDDEDVRGAGALVLRRCGFEVVTACGPDEAWAVMAASAPDAVLLDLNFSPGARTGEEGLACLKRLLQADPDAVVAVVTGHSGVNIAVAAMRAGASDFIMKPWKNDRLVSVMADCVALRRRRRLALPSQDSPPLLLGRSPAMERLRARLERLARSDAPALFLGEPGAGKALAARFVHAASERRTGDFQAVDLSVLSEAEQLTCLFGAQGVMTRADGGVVYLKAADRLCAPAQDRLAGLFSDAPAPVRLLAGTAQAAGLESWRDDLRHSVAGVSIAIPPLRARRADIMLLAQHFAQVEALSAGRRAKAFSPEAEAFLAAQAWPGNVRELRAGVLQAVLMSEGVAYQPEDLRSPSGAARAVLTEGDDLNLDRAEKRLVEAALNRHRYNVSHAARELGITRAALYRRMEKHGL